jgi:hypothetical protein
VLLVVPRAAQTLFVAPSMVKAIAIPLILIVAPNTTILVGRKMIVYANLKAELMVFVPERHVHPNLRIYLNVSLKTCNLLKGVYMRKEMNYMVSVSLVICLKCYAGDLVITADNIADKCQSSTNAIRDLSVEYDWFIVPPYTFDELKKAGDYDVLLDKNGTRKCKLQASRFTDPNGKLKWRYNYEYSSTIINNKGDSWDVTDNYSYDGHIYKKLTTGSSSGPLALGLISLNSMDTAIPLFATPFGFSIFRADDETKYEPLSAILQKQKDMIHVKDSINKAGDFNTIRFDLFHKTYNLPHTHIYLSVDHNYTPVKYEFLKDLKTGKLAFSFEVHSLEQIGDGLWFPSSGTIVRPDDEHIDAFQTTKKIFVNQGLSEKDFDIVFPVGTKVEDQITGRKYTVKEETTK